MDRSYWGNLIYSQFYRQTKLDSAQVYELHEKIQKKSDVTYILFYASPATILSRFADEKMTKAQHIEDILLAYQYQYQIAQVIFPDTQFFKINTSDLETTQKQYTELFHKLAQ